MSAFIPSGSSDQVYAIMMDVSANVTYIGKAFPGVGESEANWQIMRITSTGENLAIQFAGSGSFTNSWIDRVSLIYS
jgi:hypothetical protein